MATVDPQLCEICKKESLYKCPICRERYCSVECCKAHRLLCKGPRDAGKKEDSRAQTINHIVSSESDIVPREKLDCLRISPSLKCHLSNVHLRELLVKLDRSGPDPRHKEKLLDQLMDIPIFSEFADECLKLCS
jgi:hypothetical protein